MRILHFQTKAGASDGITHVLNRLKCVCFLLHEEINCYFQAHCTSSLSPCCSSKWHLLVLHTRQGNSRAKVDKSSRLPWDSVTVLRHCHLGILPHAAAAKVRTWSLGSEQTPDAFLLVGEKPKYFKENLQSFAYTWSIIATSLVLALYPHENQNQQRSLKIIFITLLVRIL